jgi:Domain of unknown function (DUF222)
MCSPGVTARDQVLAELAALDPGSGDALGLLGQVRQAAAFTDQVLGQLARLAGLVDATGAYAEAGYTSAAAFLRHGCGRSAARAGELVATGRALHRLDATRQALSAGEISFDATHVIGRAVSQIDDDTLATAAERQLLDAAISGLPGSRSAAEAVGDQSDDPAAGAAAGDDAAGDEAAAWAQPGLDPRELRRLGEDLAYRADPDAVEERQRKRFERRYLCFGLTLDDVGTISGACSDALSMEIIKTAADAFSPPGDPDDTRTAAQRRMDGLTAACQAALDSGTARSRHGALPHLTVLLDAKAGDHLGDSPAVTSGMARAASGAMLTAAQVLTLACRAEISVIRWRNGLPLDVGRRYRTETPAQRRALTARDHGCRFPGCTLPATWCTAHHLKPWHNGGTTRLPNLVLLCFVHHHYFIHQTGWTITGHPDRALHFTHPRTGFTVTSPLPAQPTSRSP